MIDANLPGLIVPIEARIDKLEKGLARANRAQKRAAGQMERRAKQSADRISASYGKMGSGIASSFKKMALPLAAGIASGSTLRAIANTTKAVAQLGDEAKRAGVPLKDFQEWKFVAEQNRIAVDSLVDGFKELNNRADEFILTGKGPAAEAFSRLGFGADELREKLKNPSELLLEIMGRMKQMNASARIRVADEVFGGTAGERFVELVDQGEAGLRDTIDRAHDLGLVLSDNVVASADEVSRKFDELTSRVSMFGKRVAVAIAEGIAEAADLRAKLDEIFKDEAKGRSVLGNELYDALAQNRDTVNAEIDNLNKLKMAHASLADTAHQTAGVMLQSVSQVRAYGYDEAANEIARVADEMISLTREFENGTLSGEEFAEELTEIQSGASVAFNSLDDADKVDFSRAVSEVARLGGSLHTVTAMAHDLKKALAEAAGVQPPKSALQVFREADAASVKNWEAEKARLNDFLTEEAERNSMSRERLNIEREIASVQKRASADGVSLTRAQAEEAAIAKIEADAARNASFSSGGGGGASISNNFGQAVESIREETRALELEAAALATAGAAGQEYEAAIEMARREAELLHAAQMQGLAITPQLREEIRGLARAHTEAGAAAKDAARKLEEADQAGVAFADQAATSFANVITGTMSLRDALAALAKDLAQLAAKRFFLSIFGSLFGGFGGLLGGFGFAEGGYTGDGSKYEPAGVVHKGEYVMSKEATNRIGVGNLEALHVSAKRGYANGGLVTGGATPRLASAAGSKQSEASQPVNINAPITVNGSAGTPEQNSDLARRISRDMEYTMRSVVNDELRRQMRPGNMMGRK